MLARRVKRQDPIKKLISDNPADPARRSFLLGLGAVAATTTTLGGRGSADPAVSLANVLRVPDRVSLFGEGKSAQINLTRAGDNWHGKDVEVVTELRERKSGLEAAIFVSAPNTALTRVHLRWHGAFPSGWRYLGDHWERSYGDLEFRGAVA